MINIRPYRTNDKYNVQRICLQTVKDDFVFEGLNRIHADYLLPVYCNYYIEHEPHNCFVCTDENDNAVGYIICAENAAKWGKIFIKKYFPQIRHRKFSDRFTALGECFIHFIFSSQYPAHLHINVLKDYRGGTGTALMQQLLSHLKAKGIKGVNLCVDADNPKAISFYEKKGFKTLMKFPGGRAMGIKI